MLPHMRGKLLFEQHRKKEKKRKELSNNNRDERKEKKNKWLRPSFFTVFAGCRRMKVTNRG